MKTRIWIRADGSSEIGLGHLVRCLALAHMLESEFEIAFACLEIPKHTFFQISGRGFKVVLIKEEADFICLTKEKDIVVLDHYQFGLNYQKQIRDNGNQLVFIDDLHNREFWCDLIINHSPGVKTSEYKTQCYTQLALGIDYALLRPVFLEAATRRRCISDIDTVLICFGGADPKNLTAPLVQGVLKYFSFKSIIVVIGAAYKAEDQLKLSLKGNERVELYHSIDEDKMASLLTRTDLAIVPASGILLEALACGCKVISQQYAENQKFLYSEYLKMDAFVSAASFGIQDIKIAIDEVLMGDISDNRRIIDGLSGKRLLKLFKQLVLEQDIVLRRASYKDIYITFRWATDERLRRFSFSKHKIEIEEHTNWFKDTLENPFKCLYICEYKEDILGSIRFDIEKDEALISYLIEPEFHGRGLGVVLLKKGIEFFLRTYNTISEVKLMKGYVMMENIASRKSFHKLGFQEENLNGHYKYFKYL